MTERYRMCIVLDGEFMNEFGGAAALVCNDFPAVIHHDALALEALLKGDEFDRTHALALVDRMIRNTEKAAKLGNGVATIIGMCQPERIDGGPVQ